MAGLLSLLSVARDGIVAQTAALDVTGQNVAGASTPGFVRRTPILESIPSGGVMVSGTARAFDRFTYAQVVQQEGLLASANTRYGVASNLEALVSPSSDHLGDRADTLFASFQQLALNPSDSAVRSSVVANAQWLASGFSETADALERSRGDLLTQARDLTAEVNERLNALSALDRAVAEATGRGDGGSDLRDRRDQVVREIGERIGGRVVEGPTGGLTLFAMGTVLYQDGHAAQLSAGAGPSGNLTIQANRDGNILDVTKNVDSGSLAGVREARDIDIPGILDSLDAFAKDVVDAVNTIHSAGVGLDGTGGRPLFAPAAIAKGAAHAMAVHVDIIDHPERIAAASTAGGLPGGNDTAALLAGLPHLTLAGGGNVSDRYAVMSSRIGVMKATAEGEQRMREDTVMTARTLRESVSGVSTDEEMINLQQYQRAFEASMRVLSTINEMFDTLMNTL
jgi:flagellar hook-associated protein 1